MMMQMEEAERRRAAVDAATSAAGAAAAAATVLITKLAVETEARAVKARRAAGRVHKRALVALRTSVQHAKVASHQAQRQFAFKATLRTERAATGAPNADMPIRPNSPARQNSNVQIIFPSGQQEEAMRGRWEGNSDKRTKEGKHFTKANNWASGDHTRPDAQGKSVTKEHAKHSILHTAKLSVGAEAAIRRRWW